MKVTRSAISLNVDDITTSSEFAKKHFGFKEDMSADGFVSLSRPDVGFNLIFLQTGLASFKPPQIAGDAGEGLLVVFVVDNIDHQYHRLQAEGVRIVTPIETEPWGERFFQVSDPNGIIFQFVQWMK